MEGDYSWFDIDREYSTRLNMATYFCTEAQRNEFDLSKRSVICWRRTTTLVLNTNFKLSEFRFKEEEQWMKSKTANLLLPFSCAYLIFLCFHTKGDFPFDKQDISIRLRFEDDPLRITLIKNPLRPSKYDTSKFGAKDEYLFYPNQVERTERTKLSSKHHRHVFIFQMRVSRHIGIYFFNYILLIGIYVGLYR